MAGREFISIEEAKATLKAEEEKRAKDREDEAFAASINVPLKLMSWNLSAVGKNRFEYDRIAAVLAEADFTVFQEVEFTATGETPLLVIADILSRKTGERICKGWFKTDSGSRGRHAFLWKDKTVSYVEKSGAVNQSCSEAPVVMRVDAKKIAAEDFLTATFFLKSRRQMFNAISIMLEKKPKKSKSINAVFLSAAKSPWPVLIAGDFKIGAKDKLFATAAKQGFKPAMANDAANLWTRNLTVVQIQNVDLQERFPDAEKIADHSPLFASISFSPEEADVLRTQLIQKSDRAERAATRPLKSKTRERKKAKPLDLTEDIESEAGD